MNGAVQRAAFADLDATVLYAILRLRAEVFVVEQDCAYLDLDGRDTEPTTTHWWTANADDPRQVLCYLRVLRDSGGARIGRVVTAPAFRGRGLAATLLRAALAALDGSGPVHLHAQSHLAGWYAGFGFTRCGPDFDEDGIAHTPMRLAR